MGVVVGEAAPRVDAARARPRATLPAVRRARPRRRWARRCRRCPPRARPRRRRPSSSSAAASANSWQRPPLPCPRTVTVVSPPAITQRGRRHRAAPGPDVARHGDEAPATSRASPSSDRVSTCGRVAERARPRRRRVHHQRVVADDEVAARARRAGRPAWASRGSRPGMPALEPRRRWPRAPIASLESVEDRQGLREGRGVGRGRAGGDHVERIADDVGEEQRLDPARARPRGRAGRP